MLKLSSEGMALGGKTWGYKQHMGWQAWVNANELEASVGTRFESACLAKKARRMIPSARMRSYQSPDASAHPRYLKFSGRDIKTFAAESPSVNPPPSHRSREVR